MIVISAVGGDETALLMNCRQGSRTLAQRLHLSSHGRLEALPMSMAVADVKGVGKELLQEPVKRVNNVSKLLKEVQSNNNEASSRLATHYLKLYFLASFENGILSRQRETLVIASPEEKLQAWLKSRFESFCNHLHMQLQASNSEELQVAALNATMELVRSQHVGVFDHKLFISAVTAVLQSPEAGDEVLQLLLTKYIPCADVRFYALQAIQQVSEGSSKPLKAGVLGGEAAGQRLFGVLVAISPTLAAAGQDGQVQSWCGSLEAGVVAAGPAGGEGAQQRRKRKRQQAVAGPEAPPLLGSVQWANPTAYKKAFSKAWLGLLRLPLPSDLLKKVLVQLHSHVMPHISSPLLLSDFLTSCLDQGGMVGILALNGIFTLVTSHGLEYPNFYARLYALLQAPVFRARYRARFLQLVDIFLASGMVPAYTAAAFVKKFARLALTAPPPGAIIAIAFIHNLLRRHPSCTVLLHKPNPIAPSPAEPAAGLSTQPIKPGAAAVAAAASPEAEHVSASHGLPDTLTNGHAKAHPSAEPSTSDSSSQADSHEEDEDKGEDEDQDENDNSKAGQATRPVNPAAGGTAAAEGGAGVTAGGVAGVSDGVPGCVGEDVFEENEADPAKSRAVESSLWELESLRHHYYHTVAAYVSILDKDLGDRKRTAEVDIQALLKSSYSELFTLESEKRLKSVPVAFYAKSPSELYPEAQRAVDFAGWVC